MNSITIPHIYACYPLYAALYRSHPMEKLAESLDNLKFVEEWVADGPANYNTSSELSVIEILGGHGEHALEFQKHSPRKIHYSLMDIAPRTPVGKVSGNKHNVGDAFKRESCPPTDLIIANYLSLGSLVDSEWKGRHSPDDLRELFKTVYAALKTLPGSHGGFIVDLPPLPQASMLSDIEDWNTTTHEIPFIKRFIPLRHMVDATDPQDEVNLEIECHTYFDRLSSVTNTMYRNVTLSGPVQSLQIDVQNVFTERYWHASEVCDIAKSVGFKKALFHSLSPSDDATFAPYSETLDRFVFRREGDEVPYSNRILFY